MKFEFGNLHFDGELRSKWDMLLRIVGDFAIIIGCRRLYAEVEFCLVEFAVALANWLATASDNGPDFVYTSMESESEGLVRFTLCGPGAWLVSAAHQDYAEPIQLTTEQLMEAAGAYVNELREALLPGIDIFDHVESKDTLATIQSWR